MSRTISSRYDASLHDEFTLKPYLLDYNNLGVSLRVFLIDMKKTDRNEENWYKKKDESLKVLPFFLVASLKS